MIKHLAAASLLLTTACLVAARRVPPIPASPTPRS